MKIPDIRIILIMLVLPATLQGQDTDPYFAQRNRMVNTQIAARGIKSEKVLSAFRNVERHKFVLPEFITQAYNDSPLPIIEGQTISQPYIVALMTELLDLKPGDKVLEIGTGSGYQAAILAEICDSVYTIEINEPLGKRARELFDRLGYDNIIAKTGDGYLGWPVHAPFDAIVVTAAPGKIPLPLQEQLAEGGRMVVPVGGAYVQQLVLLRKRKGKIREENILPVRFVPLIDQEGKRY